MEIPRTVTTEII